MGSDSFQHFSRAKSKGISTRSLLVEELQKAKERLITTPHPYCESDCPWISLCRKISPPGCILSDLINPNLWC
jgi:hypothetical protein